MEQSKPLSGEEKLHVNARLPSNVSRSLCPSAGKHDGVQIELVMRMGS